MTNMPHLIETALLLLVVFLIGCVIGYLLRAKVFGTSATEGAGDEAASAKAAPAAATSAQPASKAATPEAQPAAKPAPKPAAAKTATRKTAAGKNTAGKNTASKATASKATPAKAAAAKSPAKPAAKPASKPKPAAAAADGKPETLDAPREGMKDDLKRIKGIGPKIEGTLNELGIYHFDQVAGWNRKTVNWVDNYLSFKGRIDREEWVKQAKVLAKG